MCAATEEPSQAAVATLLFDRIPPPGKSDAEKVKGTATAHSLLRCV